MMAMGGRVNGGFYGTQPASIPIRRTRRSRTTGTTSTMRSTSGRSTQVIDRWLGGNSQSVLGGNFARPDLTFI